MKLSELCIAVQKWVDLLMFMNRVFRLQNVQKNGIAVMKEHIFADTKEWCFENWKRSNMGCTALLYVRFADVQELRFNMKNHQIWAVLNCKGFYLLIVRNCIFRLRNVQIRCSTILQVGRNADAQESCFQASKRSNMGSALLVSGRFDDIQEFCLQTAKRSEMDCAELQVGSIC